MKADEIILSVVIPCFNDGRFLEDAFDSARNAIRETGRASEIIVVNDGSTDAVTLKVLGEIEKEECHVLHQSNCGLAVARNAGVSAARGKYILPLDADNKLLQPYFTQGVNLLEAQPDIGMVYGDLEYFGSRQGRRHTGVFDRHRLFLHNYIDACAVYRKAMWDDCGGYNENMPTMGHEDWDFWITANYRGWRFHYLAEVCFEYRVHPGAMTLRMCEAEQYGLMEKHMAAKPISFTLGEYRELVDRYYDNVVEDFRASPPRVIFRLLVRSFFPRFREKLLQLYWALRGRQARRPD